ncbi:phosphoenolpyruvate--protein phosphotransferase [Psychrosphaera aquimarina]|uniref:phosphoenolpyruvate--protein phosphotransferase n=1 Tax=Psychrosphaera aquimarina TaxID=2044854 RepID=A0ABU3QZW8_9GAMM|nr:phosphoenolpyruvate--protein phosphotransferase [Psychrosphaera aquimarina]MDU0112965.1 phosphoenolpyruvate--protein phosphotransferase [Psychrosphaera aquimarina]
MLNDLRSITHSFVQEPSLEVALASLVTDIKRVLNSECCSVYLAESEQSILRLQATDGLNPDAIGVTTMSFDEGLTGWVAQREEPIKIHNAKRHPRFKNFPDVQEDNFTAFLGVPIIHRRQVLGVITIQQSQARFFDQEEEAFLVTLSAQLASSIANVSVRMKSSSPYIEHENNALVLKGVSGSTGVGIGYSYLVQTEIDLSDVSLRKVPSADIEKTRYFEAVEATRTDIKLMSERMSTHLPPQALAIFDMYLQLLEAASLGNEIVAKINESWCAVSALKIVVERYISEFEKMEDPYIRERAVDVKDLGRRLLKHLTNASSQHKTIPKAAIIIAEEVTASMLAEIPRDQIKGIVSIKGAENSHAAIMARALGIPAVMGLRDVPLLQLDGVDIIVDGYNGQVFISPVEAIVEEYKNLESEDLEFANQLKVEADEVVQTADGKRISLYINSGMGFDGEFAEQEHIEGIGLYRTEYTFMMRQRFPSEQEQQLVYQQVLGDFSEKPVVMRTLDVGGDKQLPYFPIIEDNPFLGWRGIRLTLDHPEIFLVQIRAMIKANVFTDNLHIMLPMISDIGEVDEARRLFNQAYFEVQDELQEADAGAIVPKPKFGVMLEVPSMLFQLKQLKGKVDFCSIGTNDLTQYLLAVDRNNDKVANLYDAYHPTVLNAIKMIADVTNEIGIPCSVCGELAGDPGGAMLLAGMGFTQLSMNTKNLLRVKWVLKKSNSEDLKELADDILNCTRPDQVKFRVNRYILNIGAAGILRAGK